MVIASCTVFAIPIKVGSFHWLNTVNTGGCYHSGINKPKQEGGVPLHPLAVHVLIDVPLIWYPLPQV